jgi:hypothetical protein
MGPLRLRGMQPGGSSLETPARPCRHNTRSHTRIRRYFSVSGVSCDIGRLCQSNQFSSSQQGSRHPGGGQPAPGAGSIMGPAHGRRRWHLAQPGSRLDSGQLEQSRRERRRWQRCAQPHESFHRQPRALRQLDRWQLQLRRCGSCDWFRWPYVHSA